MQQSLTDLLAAAIVLTGALLQIAALRRRRAPAPAKARRGRRRPC
jgi:hypothetical protein